VLFHPIRTFEKTEYRLLSRIQKVRYFRNWLDVWPDVSAQLFGALFDFFNPMTEMSSVPPTAEAWMAEVLGEDRSASTLCR
jgi:hypothetical protein